MPQVDYEAQALAWLRRAEELNQDLRETEATKIAAAIAQVYATLEVARISNVNRRRNTGGI